MKQWFGIQNTSTHAEKIVSTLGGIIGLFFVSSFSFHYLGLSGTIAVVPSIAASAVLLFAVPHGTLSQPWALLGGHLVSSIVGVTCARYIPDIATASALAVGFAIGGMHVLRCIHPPGGASALVAVIGGESVHSLGYQFVVTPVLLNCVVLLGIALLFNNFFAWRKYPNSAMKFRPLTQTDRKTTIQESHIEQALQHMDGVVDVSAAELQQIFARALQIRQQEFLDNLEFELGGVYSNNKPGGQWGVRKIIDYANHPNPEKDLVIYRVLEGAHKNRTASCTRQVFAQWAKQKLQPVERK